MTQTEKEMALARADAYRLLKRRSSILAKKRGNRYRNSQLRSVGNNGVQRVKQRVVLHETAA